MLWIDHEQTSPGQENHHSGMPAQKFPSEILMLLEENNKEGRMGKIQLE
jgi:hypothetical protein